MKGMVDNAIFTIRKRRLEIPQNETNNRKQCFSIQLRPRDTIRTRKIWIQTICTSYPITMSEKNSTCRIFNCLNFGILRQFHSIELKSHNHFYLILMNPILSEPNRIYSNLFFSDNPPFSIILPNFPQFQPILSDNPL